MVNRLLFRPLKHPSPKCPFLYEVNRYIDLQEYLNKKIKLFGVSTKGKAELKKQ